MSKFKGVVKEFPDIRIDYFRQVEGRGPPLAGFLSHVHSDHIQGLETLRSPFVYCSAGTRELLLRLEKHSHRMNFARKLMESRTMDYKHLRKILKPLPLNTPTELELRPGLTIRVTLFDANHCLGAVMFLIEGAGKSILYTGDIRSEPWWVASLVRNPVLLPYTCEKHRLDNIYLDTTFAYGGESGMKFPSKAEGISELLASVSKYPKETVFHFHAWTFGYEDVFVALSAALSSKIHVDEYKLRLYRAAAEASQYGITCSEALPLCGYSLGNHQQLGCLTNDESVRIHSCERGNHCSALQRKEVVWITPILSHAEGTVFREKGAGGGSGDFVPKHEVAFGDPQFVTEWIQICDERIKDSHVRSKIIALIQSLISSKINVLSLGEGEYVSNQSLEDEITAMLSYLQHSALARPVQFPLTDPVPARIGQRKLERGLGPAEIVFPYSRHSSYEELCHLIRAFKPKNIYPCTIDEETWTPDRSIENLFGPLCSGDSFDHDHLMEALWKAQPCKYSQIPDNTSADERSTETEIDEASSTQFEEKRVPSSRLHNNQDTTSGAVTVRKRARLGTPVKDRGGSDTLSPHCKDSFQDRVLKIKQIFDAESQVGVSGSSAVTNEHVVVISRSSYGHVKASTPSDAPIPASGLIAPFPGSTQFSVARMHQDQPSSDEHTADNYDSVTVGSSKVLPWLDIESRHNGTQASIESDNFSSSPTSSQARLHPIVREARVNERKRAFKAAKGDGNAEWASCISFLGCAGDHHTKLEAELG